MITQQFSGRIKTKIDTTENWKKNKDFIPLKGEIIIYSDYAEKEVNGERVAIPNIKIGDGMAYGIDLPFIEDDVRDDLVSHITDNTMHITDEEREFWNNKVRCYLNTVEDEEGYLIDGDNLIFTTN